MERSRRLVALLAAILALGYALMKNREGVELFPNLLAATGVALVALVYLRR